MKTYLRCFLIFLALNANAHSITLGAVDILNKYSSVGYTLTATGLGSVVALDPHWVLTAAHVVEGDPLLLVMGDSSLGTEGFYLFFDEVVVHPGYVSGEFHDDLALIHLNDLDPIIPVPGFLDASFATLSNVSRSVGLPGSTTLTGYGLTQVDGSADPNEPLLRRVGVADTDPVGPAAPPFNPGFPFDCSLPQLLCTHGTTGGAPGDSGGAMWLNYGGGEVVAAIMSFVFDENDLLNPAQTPNWGDGYWTVGTSVAYYQDWISNYVPDAAFGGSPVPLPAAVWLSAGGVWILMMFVRQKKVVGKHS